MNETRRKLLAVGVGALVLAVAGGVRADEPGAKHYKILVGGMT